FFQAEDGIRDDLVTGVQTCALPISSLGGPVTVGSGAMMTVASNAGVTIQSGVTLTDNGAVSFASGDVVTFAPYTGGGQITVGNEIGRASCRGRVEIWGVGGGMKKRE